MADLEVQDLNKQYYQKEIADIILDDFLIDTLIEMDVNINNENSQINFSCVSIPKRLKESILNKQLLNKKIILKEDLISIDNTEEKIEYLLVGKIKNIEIRYKLKSNLITYNNYYISVSFEDKSNE